MKSDDRSKKNGLAHLMQVCVLASVTMLMADHARAEAAFGCRDLETHTALPAVLGRDGTFFAVQPDLQAHHGMADETMTLLSDLTAALSTRGTTLVLLPVPARAQALAHQLPAMAQALGYDTGISTAVHHDTITRMMAAGLTVADPLNDLRRAALNGQQPFFQTDPRPTTAGTRILAKTVGAVVAGHPDLTDLLRDSFTSTAGATVTLTSSMRLRLQSACQTDLPAVNTQVFTTTKDATGVINNGNIILLGADATATSDLNLSGFMSEATGLYTLGYGVTGGGAFAAMSSYLTSPDFQGAPPRVIVWEFPISAPLASHGDQPLRELVAAATNTCDVTIPVSPSPTGTVLRADLDPILLGANTSLRLDGDADALASMRFHFTDADGVSRTRSIYRHENQLLTGQFYLPLSGLDTTQLRSVEIESTSPFGLQPRLATCS